MEYETYERNGLTVTINTDDDPANPRSEWDNVGKMVCSHRSYTLGDEQFYSDDYDGWEDLRQHLIDDEDAAIILPLALYDHSGITMYIPGDGSYHQHEAWDSGLVGFIYCTQEQIDKEWDGDKEKAENYLRGEVKTYDQYLTGDVYGYTITNPKDGEEIESCWGFYGLDDVRGEANDEADSFKHPHDAAYAKGARSYHAG